MKKNIFNMLVILALAILVGSCGGRTKNRKLVESQEIHKAMMMKRDSIFDALQIQEKRVAKKLQTMSPNNPDRAAYNSMERSIKRSYKLLDKWAESVTAVPGFEPDHEDEVNHNHTSTSKVNTKDLSDQEILDLQDAYSNKLDQIGQKIGELVTTMDMYTRND